MSWDIFFFSPAFLEIRQDSFINAASEGAKGTPQKLVRERRKGEGAEGGRGLKPEVANGRYRCVVARERA